MKTELTSEYLESLKIPDAAEEELRRFLVHRLEGEPAEVVRNANRKHACEQWRQLSQLCDPTASGRNWVDAQQLYHPSPASSVQALPGRIAEWETLETRCQSRSGEKVPATLRTLALLDLCPKSLRDLLMMQSDVATGEISFKVHTF